jgi:hypothetical protein
MKKKNISVVKMKITLLKAAHYQWTNSSKKKKKRKVWDGKKIIKRGSLQKKMLPPDQALYAIAVILSYIVSTVFLSPASARRWLTWTFSDTRLQHRSSAFHALSVLFGVCVTVALFGRQSAFGVVLVSSFTWLGYFITQRQSQQIRWIYAVVIWTGMFAWLIAWHVTDLLTAGWTAAYRMNITGCIMLMTIKFTSVASDGANQSDSSLIEMPSLMGWLGWTFFIPSYLTGPTLSLDEYQKYVNHIVLAPPNNKDDSQRIDDSSETANRAFIRALW